MKKRELAYYELEESERHYRYLNGEIVVHSLSSRDSAQGRILVVSNRQPKETEKTKLYLPVVVDDWGIVTDLDKQDQIEVYYPVKGDKKSYFAVEYDGNGMTEGKARLTNVAVMRIVGLENNTEQNLHAGDLGFEELAGRTGLPPIIDVMATAGMYITEMQPNSTIPLTGDYISENPVVAAN